MGLIVVPEQYERRRQPQVGVRLNRRDPLARGVIAAVPNLVAGHDAAIGRRLDWSVITGTFTVAGTPAGAARISAGYAIGRLGSTGTPMSPSLTMRGASTVALIVQLANLPSPWGSILGVFDGSNTCCFQMLRGGSSSDLWVVSEYSGQGWSFSGAASAIVKNRPTVVVVTRTGITSSHSATLWIDGESFAGVYTGSPGSTPSGSGISVKVFGEYWGDPAFAPVGSLVSFVAWNRAFTVAEASGYRRNPQRIFA